MIFNQELVDQIVEACENQKEAGYLIQKTTMGSGGWQKRCGPLAAIILQNKGQSKIIFSKGYYGRNFDETKVFKEAKILLGVNSIWIDGFQKGLGTRAKNPIIDKLYKGNDKPSYSEGFWTGREVSRRISDPTFDKKPARSLLCRSLKRAYKAGLTREDIRMVVDEYLAASILEQ